MDTPMVRAILNMDIPRDLVQRAIENRLRTTGENCSTAFLKNFPVKKLF
jgi:hypothetical protein